MNALTLIQPWASLLFDGEGPDGRRGIKVHETRTWPAPRHVIGQRLAIHAGAKHVNPAELTPAVREILLRVYGERDEPLPYGALVGTVRVVACGTTRSVRPASQEDRLLGNWTSGWAWELADPEPFAVPRPIRGRQGIWVVSDDLVSGSVRPRLAAAGR